MTEKWICSCGCENTGMFCPQCGQKKPEPWTCECGTVNTGEFCTKCAKARPENDFSRKIAELEARKEEAEARAREAKAKQEELDALTKAEAEARKAEAKARRLEQQNKRKQERLNNGNVSAAGTIVETVRGAAEEIRDKVSTDDVRNRASKVGRRIGKVSKAVWIVLAAVVVAAVILVLVLSNNGYTVNRYNDNEELSVYAPFAILTDKEQDIALTHPDSLSTEVAEDGIYIYGAEEGTAPYVLVRRHKGKTNPEKYFKEYSEIVDTGYAVVNESEIQQVKVGDKTLYMKRTIILEDGMPVNVERYLELYRDSYIEYTAYGYDAGANTELYYAILTARPSAIAYAGRISDKTTRLSNEKAGYSVAMPDMLKCRSFSTGYYAYSEYMSVFSAFFNSDAYKAAIYDRDDFIKRADKLDGYVAELLEVEEVVFEDGTERKIDGKSAYCYPMKVRIAEGITGTGELCLLNGEAPGCYLVCYYIYDEYADIENLEKIGTAFNNSFQITGKPAISEYTVLDLSKYGAGQIQYRKTDVASVIQEDRRTVLRDDTDTRSVIVRGSDSATVSEFVNILCSEMADLYDTTPVILSGTDYGEGRYPYENYRIRLYIDNEEYNCQIHAYVSDEGTVRGVYYFSKVNEDQWQKDLARDIVWSWR